MSNPFEDLNNYNHHDKHHNNHNHRSSHPNHYHNGWSFRDDVSSRGVASNPFQQLEEEDNKREETVRAPDHLKFKIVGSYQTVHTSLKAVELYVGNFFSMIVEMFRSFGPHDEENAILKDDSSKDGTEK